MSQSTTRSTLQDWIERRTRTVTLPSGAVVTVRLPDLGTMAKGGRIPNELLSFALRFETEAIRINPMSDDERMQYIAFCRWIAAQTVVEPKIEPDDWDELPNEDYTQVLSWALRTDDLPFPPEEQNGKVTTVAELASFRDEPGGDRT